MISTYLKKPSRYFLIFCLSFLITKNLKADIYGFCFGSDVSLAKAKKTLNEIKHPLDSVFIRESKNCVEVKGSLSRFDLYRKYLAMNFKIIDSYKGGSSVGSELSTQKETCRVEVTKISNNLKKGIKGKLGRKSNFRSKQKKSSSQSKIQILLTSTYRGTIDINNESLGITCTKVANGYNLAFDLKSLGLNVSSNVFVTRAQKLDVGKVHTDLKNKNQSISLNQASIADSFEKGNARYFLEVR